MNTRKCRVCDHPIIGRSDKKYCSDQCRSFFNNKSKSDGEEVIVETNKLLRRNRTILKKLCPTGKAIIPKEALTALEFHFHCFTSILITRDKKLYYIFYDFAITPIISGGTEKALVVAWEENRKDFNPWMYIRAEAPINDPVSGSKVTSASSDFEKPPRQG